LGHVMCRELGATSWVMRGRIFTLWRTANRYTHPGEIALASFPFGDTPGMKLRPVLVLMGPVGPIPD
jgi:hypothetical protein